MKYSDRELAQMRRFLKLTLDEYPMSHYVIRLDPGVFVITPRFSAVIPNPDKLFNLLRVNELEFTVKSEASDNAFGVTGVTHVCVTHESLARILGIQGIPGN